MSATAQTQPGLPFSLSEYHARWTAVATEIKDRGLSGAVVWQRSGGSYDRAGDVHWLTNYATSASGQEPWRPGWPMGKAFAALVFHGSGEPELHTSEPIETIDAGQVACGQIHSHFNLMEGVGKRLEELRLEGPVGQVGEDILPVLFHRHLVAASPSVEFIAADELVSRCQRIKSESEREVYREAGAISSEALTAVMEGLIAGEPGAVAASKGAARIVASGGGIQRVCVGYGAQSETVMWTNNLYGYDAGAPTTGEVVRGWVYGPILHGYWLDPGRTAVCGNNPTAAQRRLIESTAEVVEGIVDAIRPGVTPREVGQAGDRLIRATGYDSETGPGALWELYGHGLGSFFTEPVIPARLAPDLGADFDEVDLPLAEGMAITVEVFLNDEGVGTATFEQIMLVSSSGTEMLTSTPLIFW
ncbi:MAG: aminopeptidase P family protein [Actinobacteria bacterium]|nr:aminopeptidase P family protein [Actinomycetota bacterium]